MGRALDRAVAGITMAGWIGGAGWKAGGSGRNVVGRDEAGIQMKLQIHHNFRVNCQFIILTAMFSQFRALGSPSPVISAEDRALANFNSTRIFSQQR
ncbi:hypothetical protein DUI87_09321 [Hirundo rustica rustica]|uniref:Uncharacterized protein n=1 Tax=Hirundo rustica rustica TaxID=333673 RepID=A0A3M0KTY4_HIRRU|nr:hypothetical protein DUI87_09321 [Hirundo rustica rustica]